jgi:uncharacterized protein YunC (DUF1805 family)
MTSASVGEQQLASSTALSQNHGQAGHLWLFTDEGVAVGGAFDSDTATGMMPIAHRVAGVGSFRGS